ncbi:hypothetical protein [Rhodanobacter sp. DHB23]|uniref:hypothetical protein n=1 Tax=Rhodanobacter sp. DHB23 TaxID=2775923 RepID=UPI001781B9AC|nr:hypothetical protein [Rhodanobacter sp. DHB23]MBD8872006.1 hypothetical protein [Rhodanobacter sp. DHB23]
MSISDAINLVNDIIQFAIVAFAGLGIYWQLKKANEDRENVTYDSLDTRFTRFLECCSKYPELEVYNPARNNWDELCPQQYRRQLILYQILVSIMERAYILYSDTHIAQSKMRERQWKGWNDYMKSYAKSPTFQHAWNVEAIGEDMDTSFVAYMNDNMQPGGQQ